MKLQPIPIYFYILILLSCSLFSCDSLIETDVLPKLLRKLKFRVTKISAQYPSRLKNYDILFLQALIKIPSEPEIRKIQDFVKSGGTLIVGLFSFIDIHFIKLTVSKGFDAYSFILSAIRVMP